MRNIIRVWLCVTLWSLAACTSQAGWRVSFGVSPVTSINDQQSLEQQEAEGK